jgi:hypothetical protein
MHIQSSDRDNFYLYFAWSLFLFVTLVFPAKALLAPEKIAPLYLVHHAHALTMGGWFLLLAIQPTLARQGKIELHKLFGKLSILLVISFITISLIMSKINWQRTEDVLIITANGVNLILFSSLYIAAIYFRKQTEIHKRLMIFATISILGPAVGRVTEILDKPPESAAPVFILLPLLPIINDLIRTKRVHKATIVGAVSVFLAVPIILGLSKNPDWAAFLINVFDAKTS